MNCCIYSINYTYAVHFRLFICYVAFCYIPSVANACLIAHCSCVNLILVHYRRETPKANDFNSSGLQNYCEHILGNPHLLWLISMG
jgi:hypothetical protein